MAILLPHVMRAYGSSVYDKLADLCDICAMEVDTPDGMISAEVRAENISPVDGRVKRETWNSEISGYDPGRRREPDCKMGTERGESGLSVPEIWDAQEMKEFVLAMMEGARLEGAEKNE